MTASRAEIESRLRLGDETIGAPLKLWKTFEGKMHLCYLNRIISICGRDLQKLVASKPLRGYSLVDMASKGLLGEVCKLCMRRIGDYR